MPYAEAVPFGDEGRRDVAQLGSAPALGAGGRRFKSCRPDQWDARSDVEIWRRYGWANYRLTLTDTGSDVTADVEFILASTAVTA